MVDERTGERRTPRILFCAFAEVPGPSAAGARFNQLISAVSDELEVDALTLKGGDLSHIQRLGSARMMRVPVRDKPFLESLGSYQRALTRQLSGDAYDLVYCADVFSAQVAAAHKEVQGYALYLELDDFPAVSFAKRFPVEAKNKALRNRWKEATKRSLRAATKVIAPSRYAARVISEQTDPRLVHLLPRAVDRSLFCPPSVELDLDGRRSVAVFERRGPEKRVNSALAILSAVARKTSDKEVRLLLIGAPGEHEEKIKTELRRLEISDRVERVDIDSPVRLASVLTGVDVVVVPTSAESGLDPFATPHRALEAMACRRATILTGPESTFRDVITPGVHAMVVPEKSPSAVAVEVVTLLDDERRRDKLGRAAVEKIEQTCDLSARNDEFARLLSLTVGVAWTPRSPEETLANPVAPGDEFSQQADKPVHAKTKRTLVDDDADGEDVAPASDDLRDGLRGKHPKTIQHVGLETIRDPTRASSSTPKLKTREVPTESEATSSKDPRNEPDVSPTPPAPLAPPAPFITEASTESGAYVGAPKGLPLPHFAKALYVKGGIASTSISEPDLKPFDEQSDRGMMPAPGGPPLDAPAKQKPSTQLDEAPAQNPFRSEIIASDTPAVRPYQETTGGKDEGAPAPRREATKVASKEALDLQQFEKRKSGASDREVTLSPDPWAPDTIADASPFLSDVEKVTRREQPNVLSGARSQEAGLQEAGLLVERENRELLTVEDEVVHSSSDSESVR